MKLQYLGDTHDFLKYYILRQLSAVTRQIGVIWMLTPDDGSTDGRKQDYLVNPGPFQNLDNELHSVLCAWQSRRRSLGLADVRLSGILPEGKFAGESYYFDCLTHQNRKAYWNSIRNELHDCSLLFVDPDTGLEEKSTPLTGKHANRYLRFSELSDLLELAPVLVYQHFPRVNRESYIHRRISEFKLKAGATDIRVIQTGQTVYFLVSRTPLENVDSTLSKLQANVAGLYRNLKLTKVSVHKESKVSRKPLSSEIYQLPPFLVSIISSLEYKHWLNRKADSLRRRDEKRFEGFSVSKEDFKRKIHEAVLHSGGFDHYTGEKLDWKLISKWDNEASIAGKRKYKKDFAMLPSVDHEFNADGSFSFHICAWRTNDCKNDLTYNELIGFCKKVLSHYQSR